MKTASCLVIGQKKNTGAKILVHRVDFMNVFCGAQAIRNWGSPTSSLTLTAEVSISEDYKWHVNLDLMGSDTGPITAVDS